MRITILQPRVQIPPSMLFSIDIVEIETSFFKLGTKIKEKEAGIGPY